MSLGNWKLKQDTTTHLVECAKSRALTTPNLGRVWGNRNSHSLLVGVQNGPATSEDSLAVSYILTTLLL